MDSNIKVRKAEPADAEQYVKLTDLVWRNAYSHIFNEEVFLEREKNVLARIEEVRKRLYTNNAQMVYVAACGDEIIGYVCGGIKSNYLHFEKNGYAELMAMYILPKYQGCGLGTYFKNMFIEFLKQNGVSKFVIGVLKNNFKARAVYEKWGGKLNEYAEKIEKKGCTYEEVFYTYDV